VQVSIFLISDSVNNFNKFK